MERRPVPPPPENFNKMLEEVANGDYDIDQYNEEAYEHFNKEVLVACACGRTFLPESLVKHQRTCEMAIEKALAEQGATYELAPKPKALVCYICGREFGTASLEIHLKTCKQKWDYEQDLRPPNERKPCPEPPENIDQILSGEYTPSEMEAYNETALDNFNKQVLEKCSGCGRTFNPEALIKHQKHCLR